MVFFLFLHYYTTVQCNRKGDSKHLISSRIRRAKPTVAKFIPPNSREGFFNQIILTTIKKWIFMWRAGERKSQESMGAKKGRSTMLMPISRQTWKAKECSQGLHLGDKELGRIKPRRSALLPPQTGHRAPGRRDLGNKELGAHKARTLCSPASPNRAQSTREKGGSPERMDEEG